MNGFKSSLSIFANSFIALFLLFLTACGGGGGSDETHPPIISNLQTSPQSAFLNDGDGQIELFAQVDFTDSDGDINGFIVDIYNSNNDLLQSLLISIQGATGVTSGSGGSSFSITTTTVDDFRYELTFTDVAGNHSNTLVGIFPVNGPIEVISNIPDTGVNRCFDQDVRINCPEENESFYGQDFMYTANALNFMDNGDGSTADNVTNLIWQKDNIDTYNWYQASGTFHATHNPSSINACNINLGGRSDWRLPSRRELLAIVDYSSDFNVLADTGNSLILSGPEYWAAEDEEALARYIDFDSGSVLLADKTSSMNIRCVSGQSWGEHNFMDNSDGTVTDMTSELMWQKTGQGSGQDWQEMLSTCENPKLAGYDDWRLPDIKELETTINAETDLEINQGIYCSSTTAARETDSVWLIQFHPVSNYGDVFMFGAGNSKQFCGSFYSRCVR